jgi:hypothetical protein
MALGRHLSENFTALIPALPSPARHEFHDSIRQSGARHGLFIPAPASTCEAIRQLSPRGCVLHLTLGIKNRVDHGYMRTVTIYKKSW